MKKTADLPPRLSPDRAFVVQLENASAAQRRRLKGRVEHLITGEVRRFESTADLVAFMSRFLGADDSRDVKG
jgi:hypothetical protein